jgi:hypothetical protein
VAGLHGVTIDQENARFLQYRGIDLRLGKFRESRVDGNNAALAVTIDVYRGEWWRSGGIRLEVEEIDRI